MEYEEIKKIINDMSKSSLNSLNIEFPDGSKISLAKDSNNNDNNVKHVNIDNENEVIKSSSSNCTQNNAVSSELLDEELKVITSPMIGTLYLKPDPKKDDYVKVGDTVQKGQVLCIIEAMKLMNEIESEYDGTVVEICCKNEDVIDYGKPLFKLK